MPSFKGQGQSSLATEAKVRGISYALAINLNIFTAKFSRTRYCYWHFDLNAGSGFNDQVGCIGTPLTFLAQAKAAGLDRYFAAFCDIDKDRVTELMLRPEVANDERAFVMHGDNSELCAAIPHIIEARGERPEHALGTILSDDNAVGIPVAALSRLTGGCPKLDIVIHWNSTAHKRVLRAMPASRLMSLPEAISAIRKPHWWIREPVGVHGFTLLVGRGVDIAPPRALGFHRVGTHFGDTVLERCTLTAAEQRANGPAQGSLI